MRDALGSVQSALLLGGTSELALATAGRLVAGRTRTVVLGVRDVAAGEAAAAGLRAAGAATVDVVPFDALDTAAHDRLVADVFDRHGDIDLALVAFGVLGDQEQGERDAVAARHVVETNFVGAVSVMVPLLGRMRGQGHGTVVVLSSVAAERPRRANFIYAASKAGLDAFAQGCADAVAGSGVRVVVVRPGFVRGKMTAGRPTPPFSTTPEVVAEAVMDGVRRGAHTVWAPGYLRWLMAVLRHLPRPLFRRIPG
jgi:decaprenylphospho-beta-D-erythro-pentofuranosid-2-ulose 2-reductase